MIRKFSHAKDNNLDEVICWGDGSPKREFLYSDDLAEACLVAMQNPSEYDVMNVSTGEEVSIRETAEIVSDVVGYSGKISWDTTKPNGTIKRPLYVDKIKSLGWEPKIGLREGVQMAYQWYKENVVV